MNKNDYQQAFSAGLGRQLRSRIEIQHIKREDASRLHQTSTNAQVAELHRERINQARFAIRVAELASESGTSREKEQALAWLDRSMQESITIRGLFFPPFFEQS